MASNQFNVPVLLMFTQAFWLNKNNRDKTGIKGAANPNLSSRRFWLFELAEQHPSEFFAQAFCVYVCVYVCAPKHTESNKDDVSLRGHFVADEEQLMWQTTPQTKEERYGGGVFEE